jgi:predicted lipoprotein with Yx(FWY)xxD motif
MKRPNGMLGVIGVAALAIAGCGGGGSSSKSASSSSAAASSSPYESSSDTTSSTAASGASTQASGSPKSAAASSGPSVTLLSKRSGKLGSILAAGPKKLTVYLFEADHGTTSACTGACAQVWPPVITNGDPKAQGGALAADLGSTTRADGTKQVTYKGHLLYYYAKDGDDGDAYGQGLNSFGAGWYVLSPAGSKVDSS